MKTIARPHSRPSENGRLHTFREAYGGGRELSASWGAVIVSCRDTWQERRNRLPSEDSVPKQAQVGFEERFVRFHEGLLRGNSKCL